MAHNLNTLNGKVSFASNQPAWHNLGQIVESAMTAVQAIELANLNYEVQKQPLIVCNDFGSLVLKDKMVTYRTDTNQALGVVGKNYQILQNKNAFSFFDTIIDEDDAVYETAGVIGNGEKIFITAKMPQHIRIEGTDDLTEVYVLLTNTHDGSGAVQGIVTPVRVVCQNTLNAALKNNTNKIYIKHTANMEANIQSSIQLLGITNLLTKELSNSFNYLAKKHISDSAIKELIAQLFKSEKEDSTRAKNIQSAVLEAYYTGVGQEHIVGTAWGAYNAVTHYLDHNRVYKNEETKFKNIIDGESYKITQKAFDSLILM